MVKRCYKNFNNNSRDKDGKVNEFDAEKVSEYIKYANSDTEAEEK